MLYVAGVCVILLFIRWKNLYVNIGKLLLSAVVSVYGIWAMLHFEEGAIQKLHEDAALVGLKSGYITKSEQTIRLVSQVCLWAGVGILCFLVLFTLIFLLRRHFSCAVWAGVNWVIVIVLAVPLVGSVFLWGLGALDRTYSLPWLLLPMVENLLQAALLPLTGFSVGVLWPSSKLPSPLSEPEEAMVEEPAEEPVEEFAER